MDYEMSPQPQKEHCINEARISKLEAHLDNKKEDIDSITGDYYHLRDKLDIISMAITIYGQIHKKTNENFSQYNFFCNVTTESNVTFYKVLQKEYCNIINF